jgi:hypothetical protein
MGGRMGAHMGGRMGGRGRTLRSLTAWYAVPRLSPYSYAAVATGESRACPRASATH